MNKSLIFSSLFLMKLCLDMTNLQYSSYKLTKYGLTKHNMWFIIQLKPTKLKR